MGGVEFAQWSLCWCSMIIACVSKGRNDKAKNSSDGDNPTCMGNIRCLHARKKGAVLMDWPVLRKSEESGLYLGNLYLACT